MNSNELDKNQLNSFATCKRERTKLSRMLRSVRTGIVGLLMALTLSLSGCANRSPALMSACDELPKPPSVSTPLPQTPYSNSVQNDLSQWRGFLMDTQMMSE